MSTESLRARLDSARPRPWRVDADGCCVVSDNDEGRAIAEMTWENAPLIAHAPEDLEAALAVIEATDRQTVAYVRLAKAQRLDDAKRITEAENEATEAESAYWTARQAFEALP